MTEPNPLPRPTPFSNPSDRWTKPLMAQFLRELASSHSVSAACKAVGMSRQAVYKLRARLKGEPFDIAWEAAFQHGYDSLHQAALERALHGTEVPVFHNGEQIGSRTVYSERLTCFLLAARNHQGARQLGRYRAAADFWSERWDILLDQVENGAALWDRGENVTHAELDRAAAAGSDRYTAPDPLPGKRGQ